MNEPSAELWRDAKTLNEIGELTARWIEGSLPFHPCYGDSSDEETETIQSQLINFNRNGFITTFSQPAEAWDEEGSAQRAAVEGFAEEVTAKRIAALGLHTDLLVLIYPPEVQWGYQIPISVRNFHPYTWLGSNVGFEDFDCFQEFCSAETMEIFKKLWKVVVIDLQWGREDHLWQLVNNALMESFDQRFDVTTSPEHEGVDDFVY